MSVLRIEDRTKSPGVLVFEDRTKSPRDPALHKRRPAWQALFSVLGIEDRTRCFRYWGFRIELKASGIPYRRSAARLYKRCYRNWGPMIELVVWTDDRTRGRGLLKAGRCFCSAGSRGLLVRSSIRSTENNEFDHHSPVPKTTFAKQGGASAVSFSSIPFEGKGALIREPL